MCQFRLALRDQPFLLTGWRLLNGESENAWPSGSNRAELGLALRSRLDSPRQASRKWPAKNHFDFLAETNEPRGHSLSGFGVNWIADLFRYSWETSPSPLHTRIPLSNHFSSVANSNPKS